MPTPLNLAAALATLLPLLNAQPQSARGDGAGTARRAPAIAQAKPQPPAAPAAKRDLTPQAKPAPAPAAKLDLAAIIDRVQARYEGATDFRARFNQTLTNATFKRKVSSSGEVLLKKPGRMRWNYEKPEPKTYVSDGDTLWLYEPEDRQAFKHDLKASQLPAALAFLTGKGKLVEQFDIQLAEKPAYGTPRDHVLRLQPKQPQAQLKTMLFVVDPETFWVRETVIFDAQGNINDILFSDIKLNTKLPDTTFKWSPPPGVRVIDAAKLAK